MLSVSKKLIAVLLSLTVVFSCTAVAVTQSGGNAATNPSNPSEKTVELAQLNEAVTVLTEKSSASSSKALVKKADSNVLTTCGGNCDHSPVIIIPGIFQSDTFVGDENNQPIYNEDGVKLTSWPPSEIDIMMIISKALVPLVSSLIFQKDCGLTDALKEVAGELLGLNKSGLDGRPIANIVTRTFPQSVAACSADDKKFIYNKFPLEGVTEIIGEDHLYYFAYDSLGNHMDTVAKLRAMIDRILTETGHDKIQLLSVSLGGSFTNSLLEYHKDLYSKIDRLVYIVPALDGSQIIGDLYMGKLSSSDDMLYRDLFPALMEEGYMSSLVNIALRLFPNALVKDILNTVLEALVDVLFRNCTTMWGLLPGKMFDDAVARHLTGDEYAELRSQTAWYRQAQKNSKANNLALKATGCEIFDIVDYNFPLYKIVPSWDKYNADGVIHIDSTSMGATSAACFEELPADYVPVNPNCTNPAHNHISPDRCVDASTGLFPDHTFYFNGQDHEGTGRNDVIMKLAIELVTSKNLKDVYTMPEKFPQFNGSREVKGMRNGILKQAKDIDQSTLSPQQAAELNAAITRCELMLDTTIIDSEEAIAAEDNLIKVLVALGVRESDEKSAWEKLGDAVLILIDKALFELEGGNGFSEFWKPKTIKP